MGCYSGNSQCLHGEKSRYSLSIHKIFYCNHSHPYIKYTGKAMSSIENSSTNAEETAIQTKATKSLNTSVQVHYATQYALCICTTFRCLNNVHWLEHMSSNRIRSKMYENRPKIAYVNGNLMATVHQTLRREYTTQQQNPETLWIHFLLLLLSFIQAYLVSFIQFKFIRMMQFICWMALLSTKHRCLCMYALVWHKSTGMHLVFGCHTEARPPFERHQQKGISMFCYQERNSLNTIKSKYKCECQSKWHRLMFIHNVCCSCWGVEFCLQFCWDTKKKKVQQTHIRDFAVYHLDFLFFCAFFSCTSKYIVTLFDSVTLLHGSLLPMV